MYLQPLPGYGDMYSIEEFQKLVDSGCITDDDGAGYYCTNMVYDLDTYALPSMLAKGCINPDYTHIIWFNK